MLAKSYKSLMMMNGQILLKDYTGEKAVLEFSDSETHLVSIFLPRIQGPSNPNGLLVWKTAFCGQPPKKHKITSSIFMPHASAYINLYLLEKSYSFFKESSSNAPLVIHSTNPEY